MDMSASSAASSTLRSRLVIGTIVVLAAFGIWQIHTHQENREETSPLPGPGVHRSNAIRRRRRNTASNADPSSLFVDDQAENDGEGHIVARTLTDGETVVDDQEYSWTNLPPSFQRSGQNIVQLLFRVSEDATRRNAYVHRGCLCNSCGIVPIRGIRYRCANCADYDLCENCESQGVHSKAHIFYKIKVPAPAFGPRHIQPVWYTGDPSSVESQLPKHISTKLSRETGFERPELDAYWEQWTYMANTEWRDDPDDIRLAMDRKTFERCLVPSGGYRLAAPSLIFDRMFAFYDTNKDDLISFSEFLHGIAYRKKKDKWEKIFEGYDIDGDGYVDRKDFLRIFRSYYVLYRQMHRDMLEGMEDQQMGTNEAHRLVTSRQPLSSAFGQDGRFPRAPDPRTGEGKVRRSNGDEEIADGKGVMSENGTDTGSREDVFRRNVPRVSRNRTDEDGRRRSLGLGNFVKPT
jgi:Ca2+-binding EF-hand superfamily protein